MVVHLVQHLVCVVTLAREGTVHSDGFNKTKTYSDGKIVTNIEDLFFEFLRVVDVIRPKTIIAENVEYPNSWRNETIL